MSVQDLINACNGRYLTVTGPDANQCTAVAHLWERMLGQPIVYGHAANTFANAPYPKFTSGQPVPGDVLVWKPSPANGYAGHTAVYVGPGTLSLDQNYPTGSPCHLQTHNDWNELIGWFRLPGVNSGGSTVDPRYAEDWANIIYQYWGGRVPSAGERGLRTGMPWDKARNELANAKGIRDGLREFFVNIYHLAFGPNRPIDVAGEIEPRVQLVIDNKATPADQVKEIMASKERQDYLNSNPDSVKIQKVKEIVNS